MLTWTMSVMLTAMSPWIQVHYLLNKCIYKLIVWKTPKCMLFGVLQTLPVTLLGYYFSQPQVSHQ